MTTQVQAAAVDILRDKLVNRRNVEAAALYGSFARGDIETHSDIDVLVLCTESRKLKLYQELKGELSERFDRLSLSVYTNRELEFLDKNKSLFLLHLSREANVLFDKTGRFGSMLRNFVAKSSYEADFRRSLALTDVLRTAVLESPNNLHRLSYIYSLFRVFGVYRLAERGIYEFSKSQMVTSLSENFPHFEKQVRLLSTLRTLNSNFFVGGVNESGIEDDGLEPYITALAEFCGLDFKLRSLRFSEAVAQFVGETADRMQGLDYRLRTWFLLLVFDGLNQYCYLSGLEPIRNLSENALLQFAGRNVPGPISQTALETINYLHRYPLKYFLSDESRIGPVVACDLLNAIADILN